ncbi:MAG: carbohydrate binding domain-containing protein [Acidobacteriota bacterium]|jgi:tetratricopeptide (TPR) repeat protein|nr:carbohydrate binding domain-containing protein [Acidobacteriota bacterium]
MSSKSIKIESPLSRILLGVSALAIVAAVIYVFSWMFADSISNSAQDKDVAEFAVGLAPQNPQAHYIVAMLRENSFIPEDIPKSLAGFEKAASLSPNDYRLWLALGKARESNGDVNGAELALQRALELAPNYAQVQWLYGNILLRQGKIKEAFAHIGKAVEGDPELANPAVNTAWSVFNGDLEKIKAVIGDSNYTRAALASFFVKQKRFDEAMNIWNSIPAKEKKDTFKTEGENLFKSLIEEKKYRAALLVKNQLADNTRNTAIGRINNGSFEENIKDEQAEKFEWELGAGNQPQIAVDDQQHHDGNRSLVLSFGGVNNREFRNISQLVPIESSKQYTLKLFYKSDLETTAKFVWEVVDTNDNKIIASTEAFAEKADWTSLNASFTTSENTEAVIIRVVRSDCDSALCPTSGRLWFDEFSLN